MKGSPVRVRASASLSQAVSAGLHIDDGGSPADVARHRRDSRGRALVYRLRALVADLVEVATATVRIFMSRASTQDLRTSPCDDATRTSTLSPSSKLLGTSPNNRPASRTPAQFAEGGQSAGPDRCGPRSRSPRRCLRREARDFTTAFPRERGRRDQNRLDYPQIADFLRRLSVSGLAIGLRGRRLRQRRR